MTSTIPMRLSRSLVSLILVGFTLTPMAECQVVNIAPRTAEVRLIAASRRNPQLSLVALYGGRILRSTDGAATYEDVQLPLTSALIDLEWDKGGVAYALTAGDLFVSFDRAVTWTARPLPFSAARGFAASQMTPLDLWVVGGTATAWHSTDGGLTWTSSPLGIARNYSSIHISNTNPNDLTVHSPDRLLVSRDGGGSWTERFVYDAVIDVVWSGNRLVQYSFTNTFMGDYEDEIHVSDDGGATWAQRAPHGYGFNSGILTVDPRQPSDLYLSIWSGLWTSTDAGENWSKLVSDRYLGGSSDIAFPDGGVGPVLFGTPNGVLRRESATEPLRLAGGAFTPRSCSTVARSPIDPNHTVVNAAGIAFMSEDGGQSWSTIRGQEQYPYSSFDWAFDRNGMLYARNLGEGILRLEGSAWVNLQDRNVYGLPFALAIGERDPSLIVTLNFTQNDEFLTTSIDGGATWTQTSICSMAGALGCLTQLTGLEIIERPGSAPRIAVATCCSGGDVQTTDDLGATWTSRLSGVGSPSVRAMLTKSRRSPSEVYIGTTDGSQSFVSFDGLETLTPLVMPEPVTAVGVGGGVNDLMLRATPFGGVLEYQESRNGGASWETLAGDPLTMAPVGDSDFDIAVNGGDYLVAGPFGLVKRVVSPEISDVVCEPPVANSAGFYARLTATGSSVVAGRSARLDIDLLPPNVPVLFLASETTGLIPTPGASLGNLCLTGSIGRFRTVRFSGVAGATSLDLDPLAIAQPNGSVPAMVASTWAFQAWYRDTVAGIATSNLSNAVQVTWL